MKKIAFVFPGQGSQYIGMGKDFYDNFQAAKDIIDKGSELSKNNLKDIIFEGSESQLKKTEITQPAIYLVSLAINAVLQEKGITPSIVAGHSLGEYTALTAGGAFNLEKGIDLVLARGKFINDACQKNPGGMIACLGLEVDAVESIVSALKSELGTFISVANYNSPLQTVISYAGDEAKANLIIEKFQQAGARRSVALNVSGPFHSELVKDASANMSDILAQAEISAPSIPVVFNCNANVIENPDEIKSAMTKQIYSSVQWIETISTIKSHGVDTIVEVGPGKVLSGLNKKIDKNLMIYNISNVEELEKFLTEVSTLA